MSRVFEDDVLQGEYDGLKSKGVHWKVAEKIVRVTHNVGVVRYFKRSPCYVCGCFAEGPHFPSKWFRLSGRVSAGHSEPVSRRRDE